MNVWARYVVNRQSSENSWAFDCDVAVHEQGTRCDALIWLQGHGQADAMQVCNVKQKPSTGRRRVEGCDSHAQQYVSEQRAESIGARCDTVIGGCA